MKTTTPLPIGLSAVLLVLGTSACGSIASGSNGALTPAEVADRYGYDVAGAALTPVFALVPQYKDPKDGYARDLLAAECLDGVVQYVAVPPGTGEGLIDERTGQLKLTEEVAEQWGYPTLRLPATPDSAVPDDVVTTDAMHDAMVECGQAADERLGAVPERFLTGVESAGWDAVAEDEQVQEALEGWQACMAPAGVVDLPSDPHDMPTASVVGEARGGSGDVVDGNLPLGDREREVAVLDARCRVSSGYEQAALDARIDAELSAIGRDIESFEASRRDYETYEEGLDVVIAELG